MDRILFIAFLTGFIGDILLQTGVKMGLGGPTGWGLKEYFKQHGSMESLFIAGGMMVLFYGIYIALKLPLNYMCILLYGIFLDILFRHFMIFSSLEGYYSYLTPFWSEFWEAFSMLLPLIIYKKINM